MSARETFLAHTRSILWRAWSTSSEELASAAVDTLMGLGMLVPEGGAVELERLRLLTNAQPADLSEEQLGALINAGNQSLNDFYHERACACSEWPASCATNPAMARGYWDTDAFAVGMAAVIGAWESMRAPAEADELARLAQANAAHQRNVERRAAENEALEERSRALQEENAELTAHVEFRMKDIERLRARVAELEVERAPKPCGRELSTGLPCPDHPRPTPNAECLVCGEGLDDENITDFCSGRCQATHARRDAPHEGPEHHAYRLGRDLPDYQECNREVGHPSGYLTNCSGPAEHDGGCASQFDLPEAPRG